MAHYKEEAKVIRQEMLERDIYSLTLETKDIALAAAPGQFVSLYTKDGSRLLPRPISICEAEGNTLRLVYRVVGYGTKEFSGYKEGESVSIMGPLGNGFALKEKNAVLAAGGIGIPPMLQLAKKLRKKFPSIGITAVLGYRDSNTFLDKEFSEYGDVVIATDEGSLGIHGNVLDAIRQKGLKPECIYACGPAPMLRGIKAYAEAESIEAQISLEEKMACGIGACLACVCKTKEVDGHSHVHNARICKDGPVFDSREVEL